MRRERKGNLMAWSGYETLIYLCIRHELVWKSKHRRQSVAARAAVMRRGSKRRGPVFHVEWLFGNGINYILSGESRLPLLCIADKRLRSLRRRESLKEEEEENKAINESSGELFETSLLQDGTKKQTQRYLWVCKGTSTLLQVSVLETSQQPPPPSPTPPPPQNKEKKSLFCLVFSKKQGIPTSGIHFHSLCQSINQ